MNFQENPSHGSRVSAKQVLHSPNELPLIIDRSQTYIVCNANVEAVRLETSGKSLLWMARYS